MRYGYDLNDPNDRKMYFDKRQESLKLQFDNSKTPQEKYIEFIKNQQKEFDYFRNKEKMEKELELELEKQAAEKLPEILESKLGEILNELKIVN